MSNLPLPKPRGKDRTLCQASVPRLLLEAARDEWRARGLATGDFITWAMTEYLRAVNPQRADDVLRDVYETPWLKS